VKKMEILIKKEYILKMFKSSILSKISWNCWWFNWW